VVCSLGLPDYLKFFQGHFVVLRLLKFFFMLILITFLKKCIAHIVVTQLFLNSLFFAAQTIKVKQIFILHVIMLFLFNYII